ncbi:MAG: hypothetical protein DRQ51_08390 [Gammaproteobacteria bacterium]|nr:MAG: hypothetical protein DRQ51_08390 [Gammaproteobacteria bacterium]
MEISTILTYLALLITAYGITQENIRLQLNLTSVSYKIIFFLTAFILYFTAFDITKDILENNVRDYFCNWSSYLWESKYAIILSVNIYCLYKILIPSKLTKRNQKQFLNLIHELRGYKKLSILHKIIKENIDNIFKIKYKKTTLDKILNYIAKDRMFLQARKNNINDIFQYAISDKLIINSVAKNNEPLGLDILKKIIEYKEFDDNFKNEFIIKILKNRNSYIYKEYIIRQSGAIYKFFNDNQDFEKGLDIGRNIAFAILELIEDNQHLLELVYQEYNTNPLISHIDNLFYTLENTDPNVSHYSNIPFFIQTTILNKIDLSKESESVGFHFLNKLFDVVKELNVKISNDNQHKEQLNKIFNSLYVSFIEKAKNSHGDKKIYIGCHYVDYMFNDLYFENIKRHTDQFEEHIQKAGDDIKKSLCKMYLLVLDESRSREFCEDHRHYTHSRGNDTIKKEWGRIKKLLEATSECSS